VGIVEAELAEFQLADGTDVVIELNEGGSVHVHLDGVRLELSRREFADLAEVVARADRVIEETKDVGAGPSPG